MQSTKTLIYQIQQIRELERLASERFNVSGPVMMQRAGKAAFDFLQRRWPQAKKIAVFCGSGNNGGDGYVLASYAKEHGLEVSIWQVGDQKNMTENTQAAMKVCESANLPIHAFDATVELPHADVMIDAICGIGVREPLRAEIIAVIKKMQSMQSPILAMDVPTGIDAESGQILGEAVHATATITFIGLKLGLLTGSGMDYVGELECNDLQLPAELFSCVEPVAEKIDLNTYATFLQPRPRNWHKGLSGHVLIVGGELGYSGAPRMAAEAALRVGAGLVSIATRPEHAAALNSDCPEIMCHGVSTTDELDQLIKKASVIILGCGLGQTDWSKKMCEQVFKQTLPLVVDADGLNRLAQTSQFNENWVLTPHPGEAARLLGTTSQAIQENRFVALKEINKRYGGVCVLKGGSLVLAPHSLPALCDKGNPGMATAGMGDVLSGVIGGLIGQGIPLGEAAKLGVGLHAMAGDLAAQEGERGMVAMDLMPYLRHLCNMRMHSPDKKILVTEEEMLAFAAQFAKVVQEGEIIYLEGPLGAGKTTFTRGFLRGLGYLSKVKSPTYTLVEPYEVAGKKIFHFDLYRITHADELDHIGIRDYFTHDSICIIEWPEKGFPLLPSADVVCHIAFDEKGRAITIEALSDRGNKILQRLGGLSGQACK